MRLRRWVTDRGNGYARTGPKGEQFSVQLERADIYTTRSDASIYGRAVPVLVTIKLAKGRVVK